MSPADHDAFLDAVRADPASDACRLVFADYAEESGDPAWVARAEFIRVQCEAANLPAGNPRAKSLNRRAKELLHEHARRWNGPIHRRLHRGPLRMQVGSRALVRVWAYRRGFITEVTADARAVLTHLAEIRSVGPIEVVQVFGEEDVLRELQRQRGRPGKLTVESQRAVRPWRATLRL